MLTTTHIFWQRFHIITPHEWSCYFLLLHVYITLLFYCYCIVSLLYDKVDVFCFLFYSWFSIALLFNRHIFRIIFNTTFGCCLRVLECGWLTEWIDFILSKVIFIYRLCWYWFVHVFLYYFVFTSDACLFICT